MPDDREHKLITVASFADNIQAAFMREQLEANGIAAFIPDEHAAQMTGIPNVFGGVRLQVFELDEEQARSIIETDAGPEAELAIERENQVDWEQATTEAADDPLCPACQSDLVYLADYRLGQVFKSLLLLGLPLLFTQRDLICKSCAYRWNPSTGLRS